MNLYKYCSRQWLEAFFRDGSLRIGTLYDWRNTEKYGECVGDEREGLFEIVGNLIFFDPTHKDEFDIKSKVSELYVGVDGPVRTFRHERIQSKDCYAFCTADRYSLDDHHTWKELDGNDACYCIVSPDSFFAAISKTFSQGRFAMWNSVYYYDLTAANVEIRGRFHPALLKRTAFRSQNEVRGIWTPKSRVPGVFPVNIKAPDAVRFCRVHHVL